MLEGAGFAVSASHQVLPEFREYERASATAVNAYVGPVLQDYLTHLEERLPSQKVPLRVMQSNGGIVMAKAAKAAPLRTVLSGPAAGVVGAAYVAGVSGLFDLVTFDMGGTSTDVSLVPGRLRETTESEVAGVPLRVPMLDVHTVGAGGGSIARVDGGGALRVGPQSAGADPGPACYGISDQATVTDAQVVLGRILPEHFLGGQMPLQAERSHKALQVLGSQLDLDAAAAAAGVLRVTNVEMEKALRVISIERGAGPSYLHPGSLRRRRTAPRLRSGRERRHASGAGAACAGRALRAGVAHRRRDEGLLGYGDAPTAPGGRRCLCAGDCRGFP